MHADKRRAPRFSVKAKDKNYFCFSYPSKEEMNSTSLAKTQRRRKGRFWIEEGNAIWWGDDNFIGNIQVSYIQILQVISFQSSQELLTDI